GATAQMVAGTAIEGGAPAPVASGPDVIAGPTRAADDESWEQVLLVLLARRPAPRLSIPCVQVRRAHAREPGVRGLPELLAHDPEIGRLQADPLFGCPVPLALLAPGVTLCGAVPQDDAPIELAVEDLADTRGRPPTRAAPTRKRRQGAP